MNTTQNPRMELFATAIVVLSAILYGCLGYLGTRLLNVHLSVSTMLFWRFFVATLWMLICSTISKKEKLFAGCNLPMLAKVFALGAICYAGGSLFYFLACEYIGTGLAMVLFFIYPVFVITFACIFEKRFISFHTAVALTAIILGMICIRGSDAIALNKAGIFFAIVSALFYGIYVYASKATVKIMSSSKLTILVCVSSALMFFILSTLNHSLAYPETIKSWFYVIAIGVFATALPIQLLLIGLRYIHPNKVSILSVLEPVVTLVIASFVLKETTTLTQAIGIGIILTSVIFIQFDRSVGVKKDRIIH